MPKRGPEADGNRRHDHMPPRCFDTNFLSTVGRQQDTTPHTMEFTHRRRASVAKETGAGTRLSNDPGLDRNREFMQPCHLRMCEHSRKSSATASGRRQTALKAPRRAMQLVTSTRGHGQHPPAADRRDVNEAASTY